MDWLEAALGRIESDLDPITEAAEAAARALVDGREIGVRGEAGLANELAYRTGGLMLFHGGPGEGGDLILYGFGVTTRDHPRASELLAAQLADAEGLKAKGSVVIGIASIAQLESLGLSRRAERVCRILLDNHAPAGDGLFRRPDDGGGHLVPTFTTTNAAVAWAWCAELFAACTRHGRTPAVWPDSTGPYRKLKFHRHPSLRFHARTIDPIGKGVLGRAYLKKLRAVVRDVATASWPQGGICFAQPPPICWGHERW